MERSREALQSHKDPNLGVGKMSAGKLLERGFVQLIRTGGFLVYFLNISKVSCYPRLRKQGRS